MNKIILPKKLADKQSDKFVEDLFSFYKNQKSTDTQTIDFSKCEWIGAKEMTILFAFLNGFKNERIPIKTHFGITNTEDHNYTRRIKLLIHLWDVWRIHDYITIQNSDLSHDKIELVKKGFQTTPALADVYDLHNI